MHPNVIRPNHDREHSPPERKVQETDGEQPRSDPHDPEATGMGLTPRIRHLLVHMRPPEGEHTRRGDGLLRFQSRQRDVGGKVAKRLV